MKTIEQIIVDLSLKKEQSEVVDMLIKAETLRRQINEYLQRDKNGNMDINAVKRWPMPARTYTKWSSHLAR